MTTRPRLQKPRPSGRGRATRWGGARLAVLGHFDRRCLALGLAYPALARGPELLGAGWRAPVPARPLCSCPGSSGAGLSARTGGRRASCSARWRRSPADAAASGHASATFPASCARSPSACWWWPWRDPSARSDPTPWTRKGSMPCSWARSVGIHAGSHRQLAAQPPGTGAAALTGAPSHATRCGQGRHPGLHCTAQDRPHRSGGLRQGGLRIAPPTLDYQLLDLLFPRWSSG